jgi:hypothetical protein
LRFFVLVLVLKVLVTDWKTLRVALPLALGVYAPWLLFATLYYGSPVPTTIVAKGLFPLWWRAHPSSSSGFLCQFTQHVDLIFVPLGPGFAGHGSGYYARFWDYGYIARSCALLILLGTLVILRDFHRN